MARKSDGNVGRKAGARMRTDEHEARSVGPSTRIKGIWSGTALSEAAPDSQCSAMQTGPQPVAASTRMRRRLASGERFIGRESESVCREIAAEQSNDSRDDEPVIEVRYDDTWDDLTTAYLEPPEPIDGQQAAVESEHTREYPAASIERERLMALLPVQPASAQLGQELPLRQTAPQTDSKFRCVTWFCLPATALLGGLLCLVAHALMTTTAPRELSPAIEISVDPSLDAKIAPPEPSSKAGTLWIDSSSSARVFVDDAFVGDTPVRGLQVAAGEHQVRLVDGELRMSKSFQVTIHPGQAVTRVETLEER